MLERDAPPGMGGESRAESSVARGPNEKPRELWHELEGTSHYILLVLTSVCYHFPSLSTNLEK